ncbi:glycosyltransferase family 29 protein [Pseudovibrio sp. Ad37]|uniref:glycosyltransferase family 29 protein n=1 Tax=Pseudovibrio sp. Ad37 TaxID=989422 RepID=UPI0007AE7F65|nr:glycosyltransferase family 29 protein [Pseudovibrio sp. Ad37]KZL26472.1 Glycosyltransferase family 29 (sialyltransferase) [Pseudovibrio sp. Ad37]
MPETCARKQLGFQLTEVSVKNRELYAQLHRSNPGYGTSSSYMMDIILPLAADAQPKTILDYGCGKSSLIDDVATLLKSEAHRYDPSIPEYCSNPQGKFDLVLNTDVLEHVPETELDLVLKDIRAKSAKVIFHIPTLYATALLPDGSNAHCTVKPSPWWLDKLSEYFPYVDVLRSATNDQQFYITWQLSQKGRQDLKKVYRQRRRANSLAKRKHILRLLRMKLFKGYVSKQQLRDDIAGKRIAVVGNARSLSEKQYGAEIDAHDLVIRLNRGAIPHTSSHGQKLSWVATSMSVPKSFVYSKQIQRVIWTPANRSFSLPQWLVKQTDIVYLLKKTELKRYLNRTTRKTSTGFVLLCLLEELGGYGQIDVYGFDFFATATNTNHIDLDKAHQDHNYELEKKFLVKWMARDPRVALKL